MNVLALCAGSGGLELGLKLAVPSSTVICYAEREAYPAAILVNRMEKLGVAPIWADVKTFDGIPWRGLVDCVSAGYPCQPFSVAGKRKGVKDPRHLWPDIARIICEVEPSIVFLENVPGHVNKGFPEVLGSLAKMGFNAAWDCFTASEIGAPHIRNRLFILAAHPDRARIWTQQGRSESERTSKTKLDNDGSARVVTHSDSWGQQGKRGSRIFDQERQAQRNYPDRCGGQVARLNSYWEVTPAPQPTIHRMDDGVANRVDRLRACGNGVVPQQAAFAFEVLNGIIARNNL